MAVRMGATVLPDTYQEFLTTRAGDQQTWQDVVRTVDDRLDFLNIQFAKLIEMWEKSTPGTAQYVSGGIPHYSVRKYPLDTARDDEELDLSGDVIAAWTDGTLIGCSVNIDSATADDIPFDKFNPISYPTSWKKLFLTTTAQTGKTLFLFIGRESQAQAYPEMTTSAGREALYTIRSDKDDNFSGALGQYAKEDENLSGIITNKIGISGLSIVSDQQLKFKVLLWSKDTFVNTTNLDLDTFITEIDLDLAVYGWQVDGAGPWRMSIGNLDVGYRDEDNTNELHISLMNMSGTGKVAGASGEVVLELTYNPRT